jgi:hypothetical protein
VIALERSAAVDAEDAALGKALALLRVARDDAEVDGLTAPQIASVLTEKYRWRVTRQAVGQALDKAGRLVDRVPGGPRGAARYRLMSQGEQWLDAPRDERKVQVVGGGSTRGARRPKKPRD